MTKDEIFAAMKAGGEIDMKGADVALDHVRGLSGFALRNGTLRGAYFRDCSDIVIERVNLVCPPATVASASAYRFHQCAGVRVRDCNVAGESDDPVDWFGAALMFSNSRDWKVSGSEITRVQFGVSWMNAADAGAIDNHIHHIREDAIRGGAGTARMNIAGNRCHDFYPQGPEHVDGIQIWTDPILPSEDIIVSGNHLWRGDGKIFQGIFLRHYENQKAFTRLLVEDNIIAGPMWHGLLTSGDATVRNNLLYAFEDHRSWSRHDTAAGEGKAVWAPQLPADKAMAAIRLHEASQDSRAIEAELERLRGMVDQVRAVVA